MYCTLLTLCHQNGGTQNYNNVISKSQVMFCYILKQKDRGETLTNLQLGCFAVTYKFQGRL